MQLNRHILLGVFQNKEARIGCLQYENVVHFNIWCVFGGQNNRRMSKQNMAEVSLVL